MDICNSCANSCLYTQQLAKRRHLTLAGRVDRELGACDPESHVCQHCEDTGCVGGHVVWLGLWAVAVGSSACSGFPDSL